MIGADPFMHDVAWVAGMMHLKRAVSASVLAAVIACLLQLVVMCAAIHPAAYRSLSSGSTGVWTPCGRFAQRHPVHDLRSGSLFMNHTLPCLVCACVY
jgi:hypothetical protein